MDRQSGHHVAVTDPEQMKPVRQVI